MKSHSSRVVTIGVYGTTEDSFFDALTANGVTDFVDIRRRRGMRGSLYSYANATKLQTKLKDLCIRYHHVLALAPTAETRALQKEDDSGQGIAKSARTTLSNGFIQGYRSEALDVFDLAAFLDSLPEDSVAAFFCVEHLPEACHRSLVAAEAEKLRKEKVQDITP